MHLSIKQGRKTNCPFFFSRRKRRGRKKKEKKEREERKKKRERRRREGRKKERRRRDHCCYDAFGDLVRNSCVIGVYATVASVWARDSKFIQLTF